MLRVMQSGTLEESMKLENIPIGAFKCNESQ